MIALSAILFVSGCSTASKVSDAAATKAVAELAPKVSTTRQQLDAVLSLLARAPAQCREKVLADVRRTDTRGAALLKLDRALARANNVIAFCADWQEKRDASIKRAAK